jgi:hypothetical protein
MKYYNIELLQGAAEKLKAFLYDSKIEFETSAVGPYCHFEILTDTAGAISIKKFLWVG